MVAQVAQVTLGQYSVALEERHPDEEVEEEGDQEMTSLLHHPLDRNNAQPLFLRGQPINLCLPPPQDPTWY